MSLSTEIWAGLTRGVSEIVSEEEFRKKLESGRPLRVKLGVDPTAPDLHLGHLVALRKLKAFQELGHQVVFIIGDFTARLGDPSGQSQLRPRLDDEHIERNAKTYLDQVFRVLDRGRTEIRYNSAWLLKLKSPAELAGVLAVLFERATVQRLMEREDFRKRHIAGRPVYLSELTYPLFQGYDSVMVKADVEIGGTDQLFNLLMGRDLQRDFGQEPQIVMTLPLLEGLDGVRKMSKSYGNYVAFNDVPGEMFGKLMSIPDALVPKYAELLTDLDSAALTTRHPKEAKAHLAETLTALFHGAAAAKKAAAEFDRVFSKKEVPDGVPEFQTSCGRHRLADLLVASKMAPSKKEAQRLLAHGAVEVEGKRAGERDELDVQGPQLIQVGKRRFVRVVPA